MKQVSDTASQLAYLICAAVKHMKQQDLVT